MRRITIYLPQNYLEQLQKLVHARFYWSRSEAIRHAVRDFLEEEMEKIKEDEDNGSGSG